MKQRFLSVITIFVMILFSSSSQMFSSEVLEEGFGAAVKSALESAAEESLEKGTIATEQLASASEKIAAQMESQAEKMLSGLEGDALASAQKSLQESMIASMKKEMEQMSSSALEEGLLSASEGGAEGLSTFSDASISKITPESFAETLESAGIKEGSPEFAKLTQNFSEAQSVLADVVEDKSATVSQVEKEAGLQEVAEGGEGPAKGKVKTLSEANKEAIASARQTLAENDTKVSNLNKTSSAATAAVKKVNEVAEGIAQDMQAVDKIAPDATEKTAVSETEKFKQAFHASKKGLTGKSLQGMSEDAGSAFNDMDSEAQQSVLKRGGFDSQEDFEAALQGEKGKAAFKKALMAVRVEGAVEGAMEDVMTAAETAGEKEVQAAATTMQKSLESLFTENESALLEGSSKEFVESSATADAGVAESVDAATESVGSQNEALLKTIEEKGGYSWVTKVSRTFAVTSEAMSSKFESMSEALEESGVKDGAKKAGDVAVKGVKGIGSFVGGTGHTLFQAVLFMVPSIFESAFLAQKQRNALLKTYAAPIKFGNVVLQMPDSVFNMDEPQDSKFIYYGIPVNEAGEPISADAAASYPGITGPDINNKISNGIHDDLAKMINPVSYVSGDSKSGIPKRYNLSTTALSTLPIYVSYTDKSWGKWGEVAIADPQFTDMLINLNTGYIFFADGQSDQTPEAQLVGSSKTAMTVETFLSHKLGELQVAGAQYHFTEYVDSTESSATEAVSSVILDMFNCSCLEVNDKEDLSNLDSRCKTDKGLSTCLLKTSLNNLAAGASVDSKGKQFVKSSSSTSATTSTAASHRSPVLGKLSSTDPSTPSLGSSSSTATTDASSNVAILTKDSFDIAQESIIDQAISIDQIKAGIAGTDMQDGTLIEEVAAGALGPIIPIQGYADKFEDYLDNFPGGASMALQSPGAFTVSLSSGGLSLGGSSSGSSTAETITGAPADNYAANGVYVYQCANSHFARLLKQQSNHAKNITAAEIAANYYLHDYIVFFDENLNQVPLTASSEDKNDYNFCKLRLNPAIKYYVSLIGSELPQMQVQPWDEVEAEIERVYNSYKAAKTSEEKTQYNSLYQQLMAQRKQLAASSVPKSFVPLYGLETDIFGMPKISYHENVGSKVESIITALKKNASLGQQFVDVKNAMHNLFYQGPFGPMELVAVPDDMQVTVQNIKLVFYQNFNSYPIPKSDIGTDSSGKQDATLYNDILLPISAVLQSDGSYKPQTAVLPAAVAQYRGLVTDIVYEVQSDGTLKAADFSHSPFSVTDADGDSSTTDDVLWHLDASKEDTYYWMSFIEKLGGSGFTMPTELSDAVKERRAAWLSFVKSAMSSKFSKKELSGIEWGNTGMTLTAVSQKALAAGLYLYQCSPSVSGLANDYFVLTSSSSPSPTSSSLGKMSALNATDDTNILSVVSGKLFDSFGDPVKSSNGTNVVLDASTVLQSLNVKSDVSASVYAKITAQQSKAAKLADQPVYPVSEFGALQLGMYHADIESGTYVYFDASGMAVSPSAQPNDYFITVDMSASPVKWQEEVSASTQNMMSLISGKVLERGRVVSTKLSADKIDSVIASLSQKWRPGLTQKVTALRAAANATAAAEAQEQANVEKAEENLSSGALSWSSSQVLNYIANIKSAPYLPAPHGALKQDPASKQYVLVSPASTDGSAFLYTFFNVPNTYKDANGNSIQAAVMYDDKGVPMRVIEGVQLASLRSQYGVAVDSAGNQTLGATNLQPPMIMATEDTTLAAGKSGVTMICSTDDKFPTKGISSPVTYQSAKYYFYYNTIMRAYYVREVKANVDRYISMAGGNIYNIDGSCFVALYPVAIKQAAKGATVNEDDMLLPYLNGDSYTQCIMKNPSANNKFMDFVNLESEFKGNLKFQSSNTLAALNSLMAKSSPCNSVNVVQMPRPDTIPPMPSLDVATQYNVYWDSSAPTIYTVNPDYSWQDLMFLPINMQTGQALSDLPADSYQQAKIVMNKQALSHVMFNGVMYKLSGKATEGTYTMAAVSNTDAPGITVSMKKDLRTKVAYVQIAVGSQLYNYQYMFDVLTNEQLENYRDNVWKADTVADVNARILLAQDLPSDSSGVQLLPVSLNSVINLPATQSVQAVFSSNLGRIMYDSTYKRYLATVFKSGGSSSQGPFYDYFDQDGYVDLATGILFDSQGVPVSYTLHLSDLIALLDQLNVVVIHNDGKTQLSYRTASAIKFEEAALKDQLDDESSLQAATTVAVKSSSSQSSISSSKATKRS